nr:immunoglobulin heavy chain junction region [Mus musculus]MBK4185675.1 immunoglobulin heavy chain junction region [Mus musculus]
CASSYYGSSYGYW